MIKQLSKLFRRSMTTRNILKTLDQSAESFLFPMLDNGYIYPAASRLSLYGSVERWAFVFETFGFSPRAGSPDLWVTTISNELHARNTRTDYASEEAYQNYIANNPNTDSRTFWPISNNEWIEENDPEYVNPKKDLQLRGKKVKIPNKDALGAADIHLEGDRLTVFELCRYLAHEFPNDVLANDTEQRVSVAPNMEQIIVLNNWHHPDLAGGQLPSQTQTFRQLAAVIAKEDINQFNTKEPPNNHWKNWPDGGLL